MIPIPVTFGSNINKEANLPKAIKKIRAILDAFLKTVSSIYETSPIGLNDQKSKQPTFYNAAVLLQTVLSADKLRDRLRQVEKDLARVRYPNKFSARTINIYIVFYSRNVVETTEASPLL